MGRRLVGTEPPRLRRGAFAEEAAVEAAALAGVLRPAGLPADGGTEAPRGRRSNAPASPSVQRPRRMRRRMASTRPPGTYSPSARIGRRGRSGCDPLPTFLRTTVPVDSWADSIRRRSRLNTAFRVRSSDMENPLQHNPGRNRDRCRGFTLSFRDRPSPGRKTVGATPPPRSRFTSRRRSRHTTCPRKRVRPDGSWLTPSPYYYQTQPDPPPPCPRTANQAGQVARLEIVDPGVSSRVLGFAIELAGPAVRSRPPGARPGPRGLAAVGRPESQSGRSATPPRASIVPGAGVDLRTCTPSGQPDAHESVGPLPHQRGR